MKTAEISSFAISLIGEILSLNDWLSKLAVGVVENPFCIKFFKRGVISGNKVFKSKFPDKSEEKSWLLSVSKIEVSTPKVCKTGATSSKFNEDKISVKFPPFPLKNKKTNNTDIINSAKLYDILKQSEINNSIEKAIQYNTIEYNPACIEG